MASRVQHLFDSAGSWVAFRRGKYVYNPSGEWIGWLPWNDLEVFNVNGKYLGTICGANRLYRFRNRPYRGYPGYPSYPGYPGYPGYPAFAGYSPLPVGATDVNISEAD